MHALGLAPHFVLGPPPAEATFKQESISALIGGRRLSAMTAGTGADDDAHDDHSNRRGERAERAERQMRGEAADIANDNGDGAYEDDDAPTEVGARSRTTDGVRGVQDAELAARVSAVRLGLVSRIAVPMAGLANERVRRAFRGYDRVLGARDPLNERGHFINRIC